MVDANSFSLADFWKLLHFYVVFFTSGRFWVDENVILRGIGTAAHTEKEERRKHNNQHILYSEAFTV